MKIRSLIYIFAALACVACQTTSYTPYSFEQLRAAEYTLPQNVRKIVIASMSENIELNDSIFASSEPEYVAKKIAYGKNIPGQACSALGDNLNKSEFLQTEIEGKEIIEIEKPLATQNYIREHNADAMILLKKMVYSNQIILNSNGITLGVLQTALETRMEFIMPDGSTREFEVLHDTLSWILEDDFTVPPYKEVYYGIAEQTGRHIASLLTPSWENRRRVILGSSTKHMKDAAEWVMKGDWEKARNLWAEVANNGKIIDKARAAVNIGLYYEREDNALESAMWFSKALDIMQNNDNIKEKMKDEMEMTQMLFDCSIDRQHEKVKLDKQMNTVK